MFIERRLLLLEGLESKLDSKPRALCFWLAGSETKRSCFWLF
jgi:hypothetical protein